MKPLSLVLPCYNEERSLPRLVARVLACAQARNLTPSEFTLILVENGSSDDSARVLRELQQSPGGDFLKIVPVSPNRGYGNGLWEGLKAAQTGIVAWSHADEQCDPEDAFKAWEMIRNRPGKILIKGMRVGRSRSERVISRVFEWIATLLFLRRFHEINAQPKVFPSELISRIHQPPLDFSFDLYVLLRALEAGFEIREITVRFPPRRHGQSNWSATFRSKARTILKALRFMLVYRLGHWRPVK